MQHAEINEKLQQLREEYDIFAQGIVGSSENASCTVPVKFVHELLDTLHSLNAEVVRLKNRVYANG